MRTQLIRNGAVFSLALGVLACGGDDGGSVEPADAGEATSTDGGAPTADARVKDSSTPANNDAGSGSEDSDACVAFVMPSDIDCGAPDDGVLPKDLRCTGLYGDFEAKKPACGLLEYKPAYQLWSDDAGKRRWAQLPADTKIDASDADAFVYPVGTRFWKEFRVKSADGVERMAETRLIVKTDDGWIYTSYVWSEDQKSATQMNNTTGAKDLYGSGHDVPTRDQCNECHNGRNDFVLGWDALMLGPGAEGVTRETLVQLVKPGAKLDLDIPGNDVERAALGYLHANCGISCHNDSPNAKGGDSGLRLRLEKADLASVSTTDAYTTGINKLPSANAKLAGLPEIQGQWYDVRPGDPARSLLVARQKLRGFDGQMPRIATNVVDEAGVAAVTAWVASMTSGGYPAPAP